MSQQQSNRTWLIVTVLVVLGLTAGLGLGLVIGWVVAPVQYVDTALADLHPDHKEEYTLLVASAYARDHDLDKAKARLEALEVPNLQAWISPLIDSSVAEGRNVTEIQALAELAEGLGVNNPQIAAYLASPTPVPTNTPLPTATPEPTDTPIPATDTPTPEPPTETTEPTDTSPPPTDTTIPPTDTPLPQPTDTPSPPTDTPKPKPTKTPKPQPTATNTPKPAAAWTWSERLVGPGEDAQRCDAGSQQIRVTITDANGGAISGVWVHELYSGVYQVSGHKSDDPFWGPGDVEIPCPGFEGGGAICIAEGAGGPCKTAYTRGMSCYKIPAVEDLFAAGYCNCCEMGASLERCRDLINQGRCMGNGHYSWKVTFKRSW